jgi:uncharacterized membrane protein
MPPLRRNPVNRQTAGHTASCSFSGGVFAIAITLLLSFAIMALFLDQHHVNFRYIEAYDTRLIVLNFGQLLIVSFIPFPTSVLSEQRNRAATMLYAGKTRLCSMWAGARMSRLPPIPVALAKLSRSG